MNYGQKCNYTCGDHLAPCRWYTAHDGPCQCTEPMCGKVQAEACPAKIYAVVEAARANVASGGTRETDRALLLALMNLDVAEGRLSQAEVDAWKAALRK